MVFCDRFTDATHAYQGGGRGVDRELIERLAQAVHGDLRPDCTILLDVPVRVGLERMQARRGAVDRFEIESAQFFDRVLMRARTRLRTIIERRAPHLALFPRISAFLLPLAISFTFWVRDFASW